MMEAKKKNKCSSKKKSPNLNKVKDPKQQRIRKLSRSQD